MASRKPVTVLVLGGSGMLGWMVQDYLQSVNQLSVTSSLRENKYQDKIKSRIRLFDVEEFLVKPNKYGWLNEFDYIINCIGVIKPYCKDDDPVGVVRAVRINALFPHELAKLKPRIIQIATDCVFSGKVGKYTEISLHDPGDVYGKTKSLGEVFGYRNFLNIRCSIIGPEIHGHLNLLDWFLSQKENTELTGFTHHKWNGVTTLQFARVCEKIILEEKFEALRSKHHAYHFVGNTTVTKYRLLQLFAKHFKKQVVIKPRKDVGLPVYRDLASQYTQLSTLQPKVTMNQAIKELAKYMKVS